MIAVAAAGWLLCAAAHGAAKPVSPPATVRVALSSEPDLLNPLRTEDATALEITGCVFSRLAEPDASGRPVPDLLVELPAARNGDISNGGRTVRLRLRKDVHWHDHRPLTSADVRWTWQFGSDASRASPYRAFLSRIANVETPDDWTAVLRLARATADVAVRFPPVLPRHLATNANLAFDRAPVGSGPFSFEEWIAGSHVTLRAVAARDRFPERLEVRFVPDPEDRLSLLRNGKVHAAHFPEAVQARRAERMRGVTAIRRSSSVLSYLALNVSRPALSSLRVRQALSCAVDRRRLAREGPGRAEPPAETLLAPGSPYHDKRARRPFECRRGAAARLLETDGWRLGPHRVRHKGGVRLSLSLVFAAGIAAFRRDAAEVRAAARKVGIEVEVREVPPPLLYGPEGVLARGEFDLLRDDWRAGDDPSCLERLLASWSVPPYGRNDARLADPELDAHLEAASSEPDAAARRRRATAAQRAAVASVAILPLAHGEGVTAAVSRLRGVDPHPTRGLLWNARSWRWRD